MENLTYINYCLICGEHRKHWCKMDKINHYYSAGSNLLGFNFDSFYFEIKQDKNNFDLFTVRASKYEYSNCVFTYQKLLYSIEDILNECNKIKESLIFQ